MFFNLFINRGTLNVSWEINMKNFTCGKLAQTYIANVTNYFLVPTNYVSTCTWENGGKELNVLSFCKCKLNTAQLALTGGHLTMSDMECSQSCTYVKLHTFLHKDHC